ARVGASLVGGHSVAGESLSIGFAVLGRVAEGTAWTKRGARPGDRFVLTKPLGTGVICAAARAGECPADWLESALASMLETNARAASVLAAANGVHACTDVSGFGFAGHLREILVASGCAAELALEDLPALPGARELLRAGWRSSAHAANARVLADSLAGDAADDSVDGALACDPQTSGGLLAALPAEAAVRVVAELGPRAAIVGVVREGEPRVHLRAAAHGDEAP